MVSKGALLVECEIYTEMKVFKGALKMNGELYFLGKVEGENRTVEKFARGSSRRIEPSPRRWPA